MTETNDLPQTVRASWHDFLDSYEPHRTDLYRYCRHLTRSPWDAEDLVRAAVALKDVFGLSLEETADTLATTTGAIKAALHRAREKLVDPTYEETAAPLPAVLDAFCRAFNAGDLDALTALLLDSASVQVVGATTQYGPEAARRTVLYGMLFGAARLATADLNGGIEPRFMFGALPTAPRVELRVHRGAFVLVHWYAHRDGEAVRALTRVDVAGDRIRDLQNYFFNPDLIAEVCGELGLPFRPNGYRWWVSCTAPLRGEEST